jgi:hypothetical protein
MRQPFKREPQQAGHDGDPLVWGEPGASATGVL